MWAPQRVRGVAESAMRAALLSKDNPADVINVALEALSGRGCELPPYRRWIAWPRHCGPRSTVGFTGWWPAGWTLPGGLGCWSCWSWTRVAASVRSRS